MHQAQRKRHRFVSLKSQFYLFSMLELQEQQRKVRPPNFYNAYSYLAFTSMYNGDDPSKGTFIF